MPIDLNEDLKPTIQLGQCPCGAGAVWYRTTLFESRRDDFSWGRQHSNAGVHSLTVADLAENLRDDCYTDAIDPEEQGLWKRYDEPRGIRMAYRA